MEIQGSLNHKTCLINGLDGKIKRPRTFHRFTLFGLHILEEFQFDHVEGRNETRKLFVLQENRRNKPLGAMNLILTPKLIALHHHENIFHPKKINQLKLDQRATPEKSKHVSNLQ